MSDASRSALLADGEIDPRDIEADDFEAVVRALMAEGQYFRAHDKARTGLEMFPDALALRRLAAEAALSAGALAEAKKLAEPLSGAMVRGNPKVLAAYRHLAGAVRAAEADAMTPSDAGLDAVVGLSGALADLARSGGEGARDGETLAMLGRLHLALWQREGGRSDIEAARDVLADGYRLGGGSAVGTDAAVAAYLAGERAAAETLAKSVAAELDDPAPATALEALLIAGDGAGAERAVGAAGTMDRGAAAALRRRLERLAEAGLDVPDAVMQGVRPPVIALFTGHMIDAPDRPTPRFPASCEAAAKAAIAERLEAIDCRIGYGAAANGGDILFLEALAERGAEVHVVLPFATEDFVAQSVAAAGERWVTRFRNILRIAETVTFATTEKHLGDDVLFRYGAQVMAGMAELRAELLGTEPYLVSLWDGTPTRLVGGTADMTALWQSTGRLEMINLTALREPAGGAPDDATLLKALAEAPAPGDQDAPDGRRRIQAMLFADVVGFSKIHEEHVPDFVTFLTHVAEGLSAADTPIFQNTWGDAIFAVMDDATSMARYALALQKAIFQARDKLDGPAGELNLRIALHAGPAYAETDPLTGRPNFYGGHVNRAARIEPVTVPGHVYCSEQFTALLAAEATQRGEPATAGAQPWRIEYVGNMALAKKFGAQKVYSLQPA